MKIPEQLHLYYKTGSDLMDIKTNLTTVNFSKGRNGQIIKYIVIHYTANDGDTAIANSNYFKSINRQASAHYFVDTKEIVQVVEDKNRAWHCGDSLKNGKLGKWHNKCINSNSIGIEMCSKKVNGVFTIPKQTQENTIELVKSLMIKYNIPIENIIRHADVTNKICPEPFVRDMSQWVEFKNKIIANQKEDEDMVQRYNKVSELPKSLQSEIQELVNSGALKGDANGNLNITEDMARCLIINKRYADKK